MSFLLFLIFWIIVWLIIKSSKDSNLSTKKQQENKHGHRCYSEGLSVEERSVVNVLAKGLTHKEYFIFNNLILPKGYESSTQIDHIVISKYGIFVIESKSYKGWIFGDEKNKSWTQSLPRGYKYHFQNPIHQNYGHIMILKENLGFSEKCFFNIIVFADRCEFKTNRIDNVLFLSELVNYIKDKKEEKLNKEEVLMAIGKISYMCQVVDITEEDHINNINGNLANKKQQI